MLFESISPKSRLAEVGEYDAVIVIVSPYSIGKLLLASISVSAGISKSNFPVALNPILPTPCSLMSAAFADTAAQPIIRDASKQ